MAAAPDPWVEVGRAIKKRREALHWTQTELAVKAAVSAGTISSIENSKSMSRQYPKARALWLALGMQEADLLRMLNDAEVVAPPSGVEQLLAAIDVLDLPDATKKRMRAYVEDEIGVPEPAKPVRRRKTGEVGHA